MTSREAVMKEDLWVFEIVLGHSVDFQSDLTLGASTTERSSDLANVTIIPGVVQMR